MANSQKKVHLSKQLDVYKYRLCPYCQGRQVYYTGTYWECKKCGKKWKIY
ncbi:hypothetical protein [Thermoflavimicrobium daqui]|nr:hypothetical protein [Thermoflavimicrobium daqui]